MQPIYAFLLKSFFISFILIGYYWIFLRNNRFHQYNRIYLLGSLFASLILPFLRFNWFVIEEASVQQVKYMVDFLQGKTQTEIKIEDYRFQKLILYSYLFVTFYITAISAIGIFRIYALKRKSAVKKLEGVDFIETENESAPFSFLQNIFWRSNIDLSSEDGQKIFRHELAHVKQYHTYDKLISNLIIGTFWINPVFWIIKNELNNIHEFIADDLSLNEVEISEFSRLLLQVHFGKQYFQSGQNFFHSSIKRRLNMFKKSKEIKYSYLRRLMVLPLLLLTISLFSFSFSDAAAEKIDNSMKLFEEKIVNEYSVAMDTLPVPPAPPRAAGAPASPKSPISPKTPASPNDATEPKDKFTFIVDTIQVITEGTEIENNNLKPVIMEGLNKGETIVVWNGNTVSTDKVENLHRYNHLIETINIIGPDKAASMYGYKGKEKITVIHVKPHISVVGRPLKGSGADFIKGQPLEEKERFEKDAERFEKEKEKIAEVKVVIGYPMKAEKKTKNPTLIFLEGKEITNEEMNKLDQKQIESVNVWKGEKAIEKFGKKGEHGVIEIKMKKQ